MKKCVLACLFLLLIIFLKATDNIESIDIQADKISYSQDQRMAEAEGNVYVNYGDYIITTNYLYIDLSLKKAFLKKGFMFQKGDRKITGEEMFYDLENETGFAKDITIFTEDKWLTGEEVYITNNTVELVNSFFSTCPIENPQYKISAHNTKLFLNTGIITTASGLFFIYDRPVMFVPYYIIFPSLYQEEQSSPLPIIGRNELDGVYLKQSFYVYADEKRSSRINLEIYEKTGNLLGLKNTWILSQEHFGNYRIAYHTKEEFEGGFNYNFSIANDKEAENKSSVIENFFNFMPLERTPFLNISLDLIYGEIYQRNSYNQRVSFLPNIGLKSSSQKSIIPIFNREIDLNIANVSEEKSIVQAKEVNRFKTNFNIAYFWQQDLWLSSKLNAQAKYSGSWYLNHNLELTDSWNLSSGELKFSQDLNAFFWDIAYLHFFNNSGNSAFIYDSIDTSISDEISYSLGLRPFGHTLLGKWQYILDNDSYKDIDFALKLNFDCWNIVFNWRSIRKEFSLGVSLF